MIRLAEDSDIECLEIRRFFSMIKIVKNHSSGVVRGIERKVKDSMPIAGDHVYYKIKSEMVGTFYWNEDMSKRRPIVRKKRDVKQDDILGYIEALKLMNPIRSPYDGRIVKVYIKNGKRVEFGQLLFGIEKTWNNNIYNSLFSYF